MSAVCLWTREWDILYPSTRCKKQNRERRRGPSLSGRSHWMSTIFLKDDTQHDTTQWCEEKGILMMRMMNGAATKRRIRRRNGIYFTIYRIFGRYDIAHMLLIFHFQTIFLYIPFFFSGVFFRISMLLWALLRADVDSLRFFFFSSLFSVSISPSSHTPVSLDEQQHSTCIE